MQWSCSCTACPKYAAVMQLQLYCCSCKLYRFFFVVGGGCFFFFLVLNWWIFLIWIKFLDFKIISLHLSLFYFLLLLILLQIFKRSIYIRVHMFVHVMWGGHLCIVLRRGECVCICVCVCVRMWGCETCQLLYTHVCFELGYVYTWLCVCLWNYSRDNRDTIVYAWVCGKG